jgi:hypothetical protein
MSGFFIQLMTSPETVELMRKPFAFLLLTQIALRARRRGSLTLDALQPGEALIGDYRSLGMTPRRYRTAKGVLGKAKLAMFKATNRGTIATLASNSVFRVLGINADEPDTAPATSQGQTGGEPATTNKTGKRGKRKHEHQGAAAPLDVFSALLKEEKFRRLDVPELRQAYADFCAHRREMKKPQTSKAVELDAQNMLKVLDAGNGAAEIVALLHKAISTGWQGWYFPEKPTASTGQSNAMPGSVTRSDDAMERYRKTFTGS